MIIQGGVDSQGTQHTLSNAAKVWAITTGASNTTVTVPPIAENYGNYIDVMKADAGAGYVTVDGNGAETINGVANIVIEKQYCGLRLYGAESEWIVVGTIGECEIQTIGSVIELVYWKNFTGTTDADTNTDVNHGISGGATFIDVTAVVDPGSGIRYSYRDTTAFNIGVSATQINFYTPSATWQSKTYFFRVFYYI